jgi:hypothetical protein
MQEEEGKKKDITGEPKTFWTKISFATQVHDLLTQ